MRLKLKLDSKKSLFIFALAPGWSQPRFKYHVVPRIRNESTWGVEREKEQVKVNVTMLLSPVGEETQESKGELQKEPWVCCQATEYRSKLVCVCSNLNTFTKLTIFFCSSRSPMNTPYFKDL